MSSGNMTTEARCSVPAATREGTATSHGDLPKPPAHLFSRRAYERGMFMPAIDAMAVSTRKATAVTITTAAKLRFDMTAVLSMRHFLGRPIRSRDLCATLGSTREGCQGR